jgi:hypothetical protein
MSRYSAATRFENSSVIRTHSKLGASNMYRTDYSFQYGIVIIPTVESWDSWLATIFSLTPRAELGRSREFLPQ